MDEKKYHLRKWVRPDPDRPYFSVSESVEVSKEEYDQDAYEKRKGLVDNRLPFMGDMVELCKEFLALTGTDSKNIDMKSVYSLEFWNTVEKLHSTASDLAGKNSDGCSRCDYDN